MRIVKILGLICALVLASAPYGAQAAGSITISEIMYDLSGTDADHEWIELYNGTDAAITIVGGSGEGSWRFNDGSSHVLAADAAKGTLIVPVGGYIIIAANADTFLLDYPTFTGDVVDTAMSLTNTGDTVKMIDGVSAITDSVTYASSQGAAGDGNSLQLVNSAWKAATPTPGSTNSQTPVETTPTTPATQTQTDTKKPVVVAEEPKEMKVVMTVPTSAIAGVGITFDTKVYGYSGEYRRVGNFRYAFGDGTVQEFENDTPFEHVYKYPGTYVVTFEYKPNKYWQKPDIQKRHVIEVAASPIVISSIHPDGSIELSNPSDYEQDISGWKLMSFSNLFIPQFTFPAGTVILPGKTLSLGTDVTGLLARDVSSLGFMLPSGKISTIYTPTVSPVAPTTSLVRYGSPRTMSPPVATESETIDFSTSDLSASAISALTATEKPSSKSITPFVVGLIGVICAGYLALRSTTAVSAPKPQKEAFSYTATVFPDIENVRIVED